MTYFSDALYDCCLCGSPLAHILKVNSEAYVKQDLIVSDVRQPNIRDIARLAGVSTATVSRVLSDPEKVLLETRRKVMSAVEQTGYRVNQSARNLRRKKTGIIVVLVPSLANPFFSRILSAIAQRASYNGMNVLVVDTRETKELNGHILQYLDDNRCDGLIVLDANLPQEIFTGTRRPPVVFACEWIDDHGYPAVMIDNRLGAELAINHLMDLGHRTIGHLKGIEGNILTRQRLAGVEDAFGDRGYSQHQLVLFDGDFSLESGVNAAKRWLEMADRPTAMFCASDVMAFGFIAELHRNDVFVPRDVSVIGFDDIEISAQYLPALTTIHQPRHEIGECAADLLFDVIAAGENTRAHFYEPHVLPIELIVRGSCAAPRH